MNTHTHTHTHTHSDHLIIYTGRSIKNPTSHQCIQDDGSQQPLGVKTSHFDIINNEVRSKKFSKKIQKFKKCNGHNFKFE